MNGAVYLLCYENRFIGSVILRGSENVYPNNK